MQALLELRHALDDLVRGDQDRGVLRQSCSCLDVPIKSALNNIPFSLVSSKKNNLAR